VTNTKFTFNKSCHCAQCQRGAHSKSGQYTQAQNNRKLRRIGKQALKAKDLDTVQLGPIPSPYTD